MKKYPRLPVAMVAACLAVGMVAAPSALAADKHSPKGKTAAARVTTKTLNTRLNSTRKSVASTQKNLKKLSTDLGSLSNRLKTGEGGIALLLGAAPQLVTGLQTLAAAVQTQIAPGLLALKTALETQVSPALTQLGTAVKETIPKAIKDVATTQEYGVAGITLNGAPQAAIQVGNDAVSPDIPEDGNPAVARGTALIATASAGAVQFVLRAKIRSAEDDGDLASKTAGQAGGFVTVKRVDAGATQADTTPITTYNQAGVLQDCVDDDITTGGALNQFVVGTPTGAAIVTPSGTRTDLNLVNIPGGVLRTDTTGVQSSSESLFPTALPQCTIVAGGANEIYEVNYTVNFTDIPTSTTPGPRD